MTNNTLPQPIRLQRSRQHKMVSPNGLPIVYVGRPTKWGNPYICGWSGINTKEQSVSSYISLNKIKLKEIKKELGGKNLSCWCKISEPCHADWLLKIANEGE